MQSGIFIRFIFLSKYLVQKYDYGTLTGLKLLGIFIN